MFDDFNEQPHAPKSTEEKVVVWLCIAAAAVMVFLSARWWT